MQARLAAPAVFLDSAAKLSVAGVGHAALEHVADAHDALRPALCIHQKQAVRRAQLPQDVAQRRPRCAARQGGRVRQQLRRAHLHGRARGSTQCCCLHCQARRRRRGTRPPADNRPKLQDCSSKQPRWQRQLTPNSEATPPRGLAGCHELSRQPPPRRNSPTGSAICGRLVGGEGPAQGRMRGAAGGTSRAGWRSCAHAPLTCKPPPPPPAAAHLLKVLLVHAQTTQVAHRQAPQQASRVKAIHHRHRRHLVRGMRSTGSVRRK